jgi:hypothetical protein
LFAQNSTFATPLEVVTLHGTVPERVWPAVTLLERSCGVAVVVVEVVVGAVVVGADVVGAVVVGAAVVMGAVVVVGVVVGVWVVVVVGVVPTVVVVLHDLACDWGLQAPDVLPEARAPPVKRARTAMAAKALRIAIRDVE